MLRLPLKLLPSHMQIPILQGRLKGKKWIVGSGNHGCWLGSYEYDKQVLFAKTVTSGSVVYDLGGHVGFYTLLAAEITGSTGKVFVFEPLPRNLHYLHQHLRLNNVSNVTVIEAAVSNSSGLIGFAYGKNSSTGHIAFNGKEKVKTVSLDDLYSRGELSLPNYMKIDIEGAEILALKGAKNILLKSHPTIFLATHGRNIHVEYCGFLSSLGYQLKPIDGMELAKSSELLATYSAGKNVAHSNK